MVAPSQCQRKFMRQLWVQTWNFQSRLSANVQAFVLVPPMEITLDADGNFQSRLSANVQAVVFVPPMEITLDPDVEFPKTKSPQTAGFMSSHIVNKNQNLSASTSGLGHGSCKNSPSSAGSSQDKNSSDMDLRRVDTSAKTFGAKGQRHFGNLWRHQRNSNTTVPE